MKDIDFDELDKAVNSLMAGSSNEPKSAPAAAPTPADESATTITPTPPAQVSAATPSLPTPNAVVPAPVESTTPPAAASSRPAPSLAPKRRGRFMDVVHPSADMRLAPSEPSRPPARTGTALQPLSANVVPEEPKAENTPAAINAPSSDWPDPISMPAAEPVKQDTSPVAEALAAPATEVPVPEASATLPSPEPLASSPFLPDAKVEKRPLGGAAPETENEAVPPADKTPTDDGVMPASDGDKPVITPLPAELHTDVLSVESNEPAPLKEEKAAPNLGNPSSPTTLTERPADSLAKIKGPVSIAQQYKEQPSSGDPSHTAIYDTANYQEPLKHPAKKKSGWLWVVWIVLLMVVGAGGAAALYFLKLI